MKYPVTAIALLTIHATDLMACTYQDAQNKLIDFNNMMQVYSLEINAYYERGEEAPRALIKQRDEMADKSISLGVLLSKESERNPNIQFGDRVDGIICDRFDELMTEYAPAGKRPEAGQPAKTGEVSDEALDVVSLPDYVYNDVEISEESDQQVHELIKEAATNYHLKPAKSRKDIVNALTMVNEGKPIDEYDYLWSQYGLLKSSFETDSSVFGPGTKDDYLRVAEQVIDFLDRSTSTGIWHYTDLGQFQMEVYREAGNGLAWYIFSDSDDPKTQAKALSIIEKAEASIRDHRDYYILDTKVRILIKMGETNKAYQIVKSVLNDQPGFGDFQDFKNDAAYMAWSKLN